MFKKVCYVTLLVRHVTLRYVTCALHSYLYVTLRYVTCALRYITLRYLCVTLHFYVLKMALVSWLHLPSLRYTGLPCTAKCVTHLLVVYSSTA